MWKIQVVYETVTFRKSNVVAHFRSSYLDRDTLALTVFPVVPGKAVGRLRKSCFGA